MAAEDASDKMAELHVDGTNAAKEEDIVDPWNVQSSSAKGVDYDKLISMLPWLRSLNACCMIDLGIQTF